MKGNGKKQSKFWTAIKSIRKPSFSKFILLVSLLYIVRVIEFSLEMMRMTYDLSPLMYLLPAIITVGGTIINFYYHKGIKENVAKIENNPDYVQPSIYEDLIGENYDEGGDI